MVSFKQLLPTATICIALGATAGWLFSQLYHQGTVDRDRSTSEQAAASPDALAALPETEQLHTVLPGESLSAIGSKFNIDWTAIAAYNNIQSPYQVKADSVLVIPPKSSIAASVAKAKSQSEVVLIVDRGRLLEAQKEVVLGRLLWRLDPVEVTKRDAPSRYQFTQSAQYFLKSKDPVTGTATVEVERAATKFTVGLIQPIDKGAQGVWAIERIRGKP